MGHGAQLVDTSDALVIQKDAQILFRDSSGTTYFAVNKDNNAGVSTDFPLTANKLLLQGDSHAGLQQFSDYSFGLTFPRTTLLRISYNSEGTNYTPLMEFSPNGDINVWRNMNLNGYSILNSSDQRLKKHIAASKEKALPILEAIPMRQYTYKVGAPGALPGKKVRFGEVAQELYEVYPEAVVHDEEKDEWYIDKMALIDPLIKAVQELSEKVKSLETELKTWKENANGNNH